MIVTIRDPIPQLAPLREWRSADRRSEGETMEIRQLEYFRAIVDAGTISGAARELHMTQPPLSYQMKMLE